MPIMAGRATCSGCGTQFPTQRDFARHTEVEIPKMVARGEEVRGMTVWRMVHGPPSFVCVAPLCPDQPCALCDMIPEFQGIVPDHTARHCGFLQVANKVDGESRFPAPAPRPYTSELLVRTWVNCQVIAARGGIRNMHDAQEVRLLADILQTVNGGPEGYQVAHLHRLVSEWLVNVDETDEEEVEWGAWDRDWASTTFIDALVKQCDREERALSDFTDARNAPVVRTWFLDFWNHIAATLSDPDAVLKLKTKCLVVRTQLLDLMRYDEDYEGCLEDLEELGEPDVFEMREHKGRNFGDLHMSMFLGMLSDWVVALGALGRYSEALAMAWRTFTIAGEEPFTDCVSHPLEDIVCALLDLPREDLFPLVGHWVTLLMSHDEDGEFDMRAYVEYTIEDHMKREERNELFAFLRQELGVDWV